jgi:hypothetical protein
MDDAERIHDLTVERDRAQTLARALLKQVGEPGTCRACGRPIFWVRHLGKEQPVPYDLDGLNHFASCPRADQFRKKKEKENGSDTH